MEVELTCEYDIWKSTVESSDQGSDQYICSVQSAVISKPNTRIREFVGSHLPGKSNEDVERIEFIGNKVEYFPRGLTQQFPNLKEITIFQCGLKEVKRQDLVGLEGVTWFSLACNELKSVQPDLLKDKKKLRKISLFGNKLMFLDSRTFVHIKKQLTRLDLCGNTTIDAFYGAGGDRAKSVETVDKFLKLIDEKCAKPEVQNEADREKAHIAFEQLWASRRFSDFTIVVGKENIKVHKNILGIQSSVFAAMFETDMEEYESGQMTIVDFSASAVEEFLQFLYTGEAPDAANALEVFALASKYDVESLKQIIERIIGNNIDEDNAIEVLKFGNLHSSEILISKAFDEVKLANTELELEDKMKNKPENIEKLLAAKIQHDQEIAEIRNRYLEMMKNLNEK